MRNPEFDWDDEFDIFLGSLNDIEAAKLLAVIEKIEQFGLQIAQRQKWIKKLEDNLYEIRVNASGNALRGLYFQIKNNNYFITHGFKKKTNKTPKREITKGKSIRNRILKNI
ncbi:Phage-related protein [Atopostipes suicloacalis DSM 15692]|uniref:Phage-related protein n=1 Tax=Atopostipes suicloacalis DSM 15692 TaxID=1121025 RepID=A0A1M4SM44_9LACT|nr:type II toxin-antitoxin system RelE/ParE family toxin [Atopostipes suicloacalis]SHE33281.1 Phage-related protein [Atopostipes suicloacalis DSM 15692]